MNKANWDAIVFLVTVFLIMLCMLYSAVKLEQIKECAKTTPYLECYKVIMGK